MSNDAFEKWWETTSIRQYNEYQEDPQACAKDAWQAAITECQAICGNQYQFLVDAMEKLK